MNRMVVASLLLLVAAGSTLDSGGVSQAGFRGDAIAAVAGAFP